MALPFKVVAVHGLKGGVGKSAVSVNLAIELARRGHPVGLLDADLDSPYMSEVLGLKGKVDLNEQRLMVPVPFAIDGAKGPNIQVMSFSAWVPDEFGGASMHGEFHQRWIGDAVAHTAWGPTRILVADLPAGQSDEFLMFKAQFGDDLLGLVGVAMPNLVSSLQRVYNAAAYHHLRILGVVDNMSGPMFGQGGVERYCKEKGLRFFGTIPLDVEVRKRHESGEPRLPDRLLGPIREAASAVERELPTLKTEVAHK